MTEPYEQPRRAFLQQLVGAGAVVAGTSLLSGCAAATVNAHATNSPSSAAPASFDMTWTRRLARYRTAYDSPEVYSGAALSFGDALISGYKAVGVAESEVTPVLILRHAASVMVLDDAIWERLSLGESTKLKDPATGETARRNPFIKYNAIDKHSVVDEDSALDALIRRGAVVLTCNLALTGLASRLSAKETQFTPEAALAELKRHVLPGVYVMPSGIFAVSAAQDAGCHYMRVLI